MRVFNANKTEELTDYDLEQGFLLDDKLFVAHHEAVEPRETKSYRGTVVENGEEVEAIIYIRAREGREAYDEYEDIKVYVPYTPEQMEQRKQNKYIELVGRFMRERYSINDELAILRQRDLKQEEFARYNAYAEECKKNAKEKVGL